VFSNSNQWIDWLNQMYLEIDTVENMSLEKQQIFLKQYIDKILVDYNSKTQSHQFIFEFKYPIVEDEVIIEGRKNGKRVYQIKEGTKTSSFKLPIQNNTNRLSKNDRTKLDKMITKLRVENSLSLSKVSEELNKKGFRTVTNKNWDKSKLSSYIKHMKVDVGK
jgi:disulfide oxidoreductase YuzD